MRAPNGPGITGAPGNKDYPLRQRAQQGCTHIVHMNVYLKILYQVCHLRVKNVLLKYGMTL